MQSVNITASKLVAEVNGVQVFIVKVDGELKVWMGIGDNTTQDHARAALPQVLYWRDMVRRWDERKEGDRILAQLWQRKQEGEKTSEIAAWIVQQVNAQIDGAGDLLQAIGLKPGTKPELDQAFIQRVRGRINRLEKRRERTSLGRAQVLSVLDEKAS